MRAHDRESLDCVGTWARSCRPASLEKRQVQDVVRPPAKVPATTAERRAKEVLGAWCQRSRLTRLPPEHRR